MNGPHLESGTLTEFQPLGADGDTLFRSALELRAAIARRLGAEIAASFAVPQPNADGDTLDWYAPEPGDVVRWDQVPEQQRDAVRLRVETLQQDILQLAHSLIAERPSERQAFGRLLEHAATIPDASHIFLVGQRPVLSFWGFRARGGDPVAPLFPGQVPIHPRGAATPLPPPQPSLIGRLTASLATHRSRPILWPVLVLLLLLALLAPFLFRSSDEPSPAALPASAEAPPAEALVIPAEAVDTGSTDFLTGVWQASGDELVDTETRRPIVLGFHLTGGVGEMRVTEQDGTLCAAPVDASFNGDELTLRPRTAIFCDGRDPFYGVTVTCRPSTDRRADCSGVFPNGNSVRVQLRKESEKDN